MLRNVIQVSTRSFSNVDRTTIDSASGSREKWGVGGQHLRVRLEKGVSQ